MHTEDSPFPCDFPIKVVGHNKPEFKVAVLTIIRKHFPTLAESSIQSRCSKDNTYLSLTITVHATNQDTLDAVYKKLSAHEHTLFVL